MSDPDIGGIGLPYRGVRGAFEIMKLPDVKVIGNVMSSTEMKSGKSTDIRKLQLIIS